MQSYVIYLIRHGAVEETLKGHYIGRTDAHLSLKGKEALLEIKENYGYPSAERVYSSPLSRCLETCGLIYPGKPVQNVSSLAECDFGEWEGKSAVELAGDPAFAEWLRNSDQTPPPGGESGKEFAARVGRGFERIVEEMSGENIRNAAIVTHGGVIMTILGMYGLPQAESYRWRMDNGYGFAVRVTPMLWMRDRVAEVFDTVPFAPKRMEEEKDW